MIIATGYVAMCEHLAGAPGRRSRQQCPRTLNAADWNALIAVLADSGWQYGVNNDGTPAKNNRTFCPAHHRPWRR